MCKEKQLITSESTWKHIQDLDELIEEANKKGNLHVLLEIEAAKNIIQHLITYVKQDNQRTKPHKPKIERIVFTCPTCKNEVKKVTNQSNKVETEYVKDSYCSFCGTLLTWEEAEEMVVKMVKSYA